MLTSRYSATATGIGQLRRVERVQHGQQRAEQRHAGQRERRRHAAVHVGVRGAVDHAGRMHEQIRSGRARRRAASRQEEHRGERATDAAGRPASSRRIAAEPRRQAPGNEIERARAERRHHDERLRNAAHELQEGQREDVEGDVAAEDRIRPGRTARRAATSPMSPTATRRRGR